jgi:hypothetical protein
MNGNHAAGGSGKQYTRAQFIQMLEAALQTRCFRFGRQAALAWLAIYPGDLQINLIQARLLLGEGKTSQALPMLDRLMRLDPEFPDVYRSVAQHTYGTDTARYEHSVTSLVALREGRPAGPAIKEWGPALRESRHLLEHGMFREAEPTIKQVLDRTEVPLIAEVLHLKLISQTRDVQTLYQLADLYRGRCPDCLQFNLYLADALMQMGNEPEAVNLLHRSMSMDAAGQVAERMWGSNHPYRAIWPEDLSIHLDIAIPADVAARLGWNWMLPFTSSIPTNLPVVAQAEAVPTNADEPSIPDLEPEPQESSDVQYSVQPEDELTSTQPEKPGTRKTESAKPSKKKVDRQPNAVESEFERIAQHLKRPAIGRADGRYPVYLIFSTRKGLEKQYGPQTTTVLDTELRRLADAVRRRTGWETVVYYPDDERSAAQYGVDVVTERDPWKLKLAIHDLDKSLAKKGLMIGMMLIVGGQQVIPFHDLPNPTDDFDEKVSSDNPYATLDSNYFVPEWPVGRLPGSNGADAGPILEQLRYLVAFHNRRTSTRKLDGLFAPILAWLDALGRTLGFKRDKPNYGFTTAVWRRSSLAVFRPVGSPQHVLVSPPQVSGSVPVDKLLAPELTYFNLHGLSDAGEWYGQREPGTPGSVDYPVALSPKELHRNGHAPRIVFSEACYGGLVQNKTEDDALSLKFLSLGTLNVIGSTCIAYGAVSTPLVAADLLGNYFWQQIKSGRTVGEALMVAKVELVREMIKRQGYLDAEDQKTLLSFVLYGDPMVSLDSKTRLSKNQLRFKRHGMVKTIEERPIQENAASPVSNKVLEQVKDAVSSCLPGLDGAEVRIHEEYGVAATEMKEAKSAKSGRAPSPSTRYVVTMNKNIQFAKSIHRHYVRATVENGKVVKLAISR